MQRKNIIIIFPLVFVLGLSLILFDSASAQWRTQKIPSSAKDTDLSLSPSKGSDDAPVEIAVFSCFE
jgi:hypothetical protein